MNGLKGESFTETLRTLEKEEKEKENRKQNERARGRPSARGEGVKEAKEKRRES
jgi:hypothetical protein